MVQWLRLHPSIAGGTVQSPLGDHPACLIVQGKKKKKREGCKKSSPNMMVTGVWHWASVSGGQ